jgi:putative intracellular protease/amidase
MNHPTATVLIPLPERDFDPSEAAVSWKMLKAAGHSVVFATPDGKRAYADPLMLSGEELDIWGFVPGLKKLKLLGLILRANDDARRAYAEMERDPAFLRPLSYDAIAVDTFDGLLLPGGHWSRGMRAYLENDTLQRTVAAFFDADKPVAAVCHGVVLAARSISARTGRSVLHGRKTTALTWKLESSAWNLMRFCGRFWNPGYYRTYAEQPGEVAGYRSVQAEVTRALARPEDFLDVPNDAPDRRRKASGLFRDSVADARPAFVVRDGNYISARWPGDIHAFASTFSELLSARAKQKPAIRPGLAKTANPVNPDESREMP